MFDDDLPKAKTNTFPKNLEGVSIEELQIYIGELKMEIERVEADIERKKASHQAANSFFKT